MKLIIDNNIPYIADVFENFCDVRYIASGDIDSTVVKDADGLIIRTRTRCDEALLAGSNVKMIATATIGMDHIDIGYAAKNGIAVSNCAGCNADAVSQWVFAALKALNINALCAPDKIISNQNPLEKEVNKCNILGIIGVGNVGKSVEKRAREFGFEVLRCDPIRAQNEDADGFVDLDKLLNVSDIVTMHVPLDESTFGMCDETFFEKMRGGVFLNASRGEVVNEVALKLAIKSGKLQKVALDVWCCEPKIDAQLVDSVQIATPHIAGYSARGKANATMMAVRQVASFFGITELENWQPDVKASYEEVKNYNIMDDHYNLQKAVCDFESLRTQYKYR